MKRIIAIMLAALTLCALLASCSNKGDSSDVGNGNSQNGAADTTSENGNSQNAASDVQYIKDKGTLIIGITEYEPMNYQDENKEWTGFDTEFAQAVAKKLGVEAQFIVIDWDNKFAELKSKSIDCIWNGMTITDEVKLNADVSKPYVKNAQVVVMDAGKADDYTDIESMKDLSFAAEAGSAGEKALADLNYNCNSVGTQADALLEVSSGSADACVIDITMANAMTGEGTSYASLVSVVELQSEEYGIAFRKGTDTAEAVNSIMDELMNDGTLDSLAEKYSLTLVK